jgi:hypothetical protein
MYDAEPDEQEDCDIPVYVSQQEEVPNWVYDSSSEYLTDL